VRGLRRGGEEKSQGLRAEENQKVIDARRMSRIPIQYRNPQPDSDVHDIALCGAVKVLRVVE